MPWYTRWRNVFRSEELDRELRDELAHHLAESCERLEARGMSHEDAVRAARRRLGNYSIQKESTRDMNVAAWLDQTRADLMYGLRQLRLSPGFTAVAVLSLALGIGANTAIFQLVNAIRLKKLPVQDPQELVALDFQKDSARGGSWSSRSAIFTYPQWEAIRMRQQAYSGLVAWSATRFNLTTGGEPRFAQGLYVNGDFFRVLGVNSMLGRTFTAADDSTSCNAGAVISYSFWQREFGGDAQVLGRKLSLDGYTFPVIGVTPPSFFGVEVGYGYDAAIPLCADRLVRGEGNSRIPNRTAWWLSIIGRLKPGWNVKTADAELRALSPGIMRATIPPEYGPDMAKRFLANKLTVTRADNGVSGLREQSREPLNLLLAITGLVLLIACANIANLLFARATVREPEMAARLAMGASHSRVIRQLLVESLLLAISGTVVGIAVASALSSAFVAFLQSPDSPTVFSLSYDWRVLAFTVSLAVATCLLFGLAPALRCTNIAPSAAMRSSGRTSTAGPERFGIRRTLVITQVALSMVLLAGALLFIRSLHRLLTTDTGFESHDMLAVGLDYSKMPHAEKERLRIDRQLEEKLASIPGVIESAQVAITPLSGAGWDSNIGPDGAPAADNGKSAWLNRVSPGYFRTMGTRLLAGREFNDYDRLSSPKVAIVNEAFARKYFPGVNPLGHTFHRQVAAGKPEPLFQIVGLVGNTKYQELREDFKPIAFFPIAQDEEPGPDATFVLRLAGAPGPVMKRAKAAIAEMSPSIAIQFEPFSRLVDESVKGERLMAILSGAFGGLATLLATLGLYGVISYMVARRRKEIGIRMALGADRGGVIRLVLREAVLLLCIGLLVGIGLSLWTGQLAATLLYGVKPRDTVSLISAALLLGAVALLASFIPARRAAADDPMSALRME